MRLQAGLIDFNDLQIADGHPFETTTQQLINTIADIINGKKTKSELFHDREIAIFKTGVTL